MKVVAASPSLVRRAVELRKVYNVGFWDAGIIAAAEESECDRIMTEDFNPGQYYGGILIVNPFAE
jgi:predicted nucleic acid-binding protein